MKKFLIIVLVVLLAILAAMCGYVWYQTSHIFVDDVAYAKKTESLDFRGQDVTMEHVLTVKANLPDCEILWDVPFQGKKVSSDTKALTITTLQEQDFAMLPYLTELKTIDATGCGEYALLAQLRETFPKLEVSYQIPIGGQSVETDVTELTLKAGEYDYATLLANLKFLPELTHITFPATELTFEEIDQLKMEKDGLSVDFTVTFLGQETDPAITTLDLSHLTAEEVEQAAQDLAKLKKLESVELMNAQGTSNLSTADVKALKDAAPGVSFHYVFTLLGKTISTTETTEVVFTNNQKIRDAQEPEIRMALELMENCERFVLDNCRVSNEVCAKLREDFRDKTKFVWRVFFGDGGSCLTDREVIKAVYGLTDDNCGALMYCEDVRFMDIGHNEYLDAVPFVAYMPKLEAIIVSGAPIKSLEPFAACESLVFLELSNCSYITDISPLANCKNLKMLNLSYTSVTDMSPVDEIPLTNMTYIYNDLSPEEEARFIEVHPDCWTVMEGEQPYGKGWRTDEDGNYAEYYSMLASKEVFDYFGNATNTQW